MKAEADIDTDPSRAGSLDPYEFDGILNFRDVGKTINTYLNQKIIREGLLYRSAKLDDASANDRHRLQADFGIETVIDLRTKTEVQRAAQKRRLENHSQIDADVVEIPGARHVQIPLTGRRFEIFLLLQLSFWNILKFLLLLLFTQNRIPALTLLAQKAMIPRGLTRLGLDTLDHSRPEIARTLHALLASLRGNRPVLIHCTQGKDRTSLIAILTLLILSCSSSSSPSPSNSLSSSSSLSLEKPPLPIIPIQAITHDHLLSDNVPASVQKKVAAIRLAEIQTLGLPPSFALAAPGLVEGVVAHLESRYGGLDAYLDGIGFGLEERSALCEILLY